MTAIILTDSWRACPLSRSYLLSSNFPSWKCLTLEKNWLNPSNTGDMINRYQVFSGLNELSKWLKPTCDMRTWRNDNSIFPPTFYIHLQTGGLGALSETVTMTMAFWVIPMPRTPHWHALRVSFLYEVFIRRICIRYAVFWPLVSFRLHWNATRNLKFRCSNGKNTIDHDDGFTVCFVSGYLKFFPAEAMALGYKKSISTLSDDSCHLDCQPAPGPQYSMS